MNRIFWLIPLLMACGVANAQTKQKIGVDQVTIGNPTNVDKTIKFDIGNGTTNPSIKANDSTGLLQFTNDGTTYKNFGSGSGGGADGINILAGRNGDAEDGLGGWTASTPAQFTRVVKSTNPTLVINGDASFKFDPAAQNDKVTSTGYAITEGLYGRACEARISYYGGDDKTILEVINNDNEVVASVQLKTHSISGPESAFFICPTKTAVTADADKGILKFQLRQSTTGDGAALTWDDAYNGSLIGLAETTTPDTFTAKVSTSGVVSDLTSDSSWIGNATISDTSLFTFTLSGFTVAPNCEVSVIDPSLDGAWQAKLNAQVTATTLVVRTGVTDATVSFTKATRGFNVRCTKIGADAKQSFQVYKSIPRTSDVVNEFTAKASSSGVISDEDADFINGNCVHSPTGTYTCTLVTSLFSVAPNVTVSASNSGSGDVCGASSVSTSSIVIKCFDSSSKAALGTSFVLKANRASTDVKTTMVQPVVVPNAESGTYNAVITAGTNATSVTSPTTCNYLRVGSNVIASCRFDSGCTAASGTQSILTFTLPIATTQGSTITGTFGSTVANEQGRVTNSSNIAQLTYACNNTGAATRTISFSYLVP